MASEVELLAFRCTDATRSPSVGAVAGSRLRIFLASSTCAWRAAYAVSSLVSACARTHTGWLPPRLRIFLASSTCAWRAAYAVSSMVSACARTHGVVRYAALDCSSEALRSCHTTASTCCFSTVQRADYVLSCLETAAGNSCKALGSAEKWGVPREPDPGTLGREHLMVVQQEQVVLIRKHFRSVQGDCKGQDIDMHVRVAGAPW